MRRCVLIPLELMLVKVPIPLKERIELQRESTNRIRGSRLAYLRDEESVISFARRTAKDNEQTALHIRRQLPSVADHMSARSIASVLSQEELMAARTLVNLDSYPKPPQDLGSKERRGALARVILERGGINA